MKGLQIITMVVVLVLVISSWAGAAAVSDPLAGFWAYDNLGTGASDDHVDLSLVTAEPGILNYSAGNNTWNILGPRSNLNTIHIETGTAFNFGANTEYVLGAKGDDDPVGAAPHNPLTATAWLLGSGIIGLIGIKRKKYCQVID
jgi:hypothetical protein